ncbi:MAG: hypothetical protein L3K13_02760 [Thermoplasmata archaeon]|nr:hypothetical protein [Thermoplasmata archaeon]
MSASLWVGVGLGIGLIGLNLADLLLFSYNPAYVFLAITMVLVGGAFFVRNVKGLETERDELRASALRFQRAREEAPTGGAPTSTSTTLPTPTPGVAPSGVPIVQCARCGAWETRVDSAYCRVCGARLA